MTITGNLHLTFLPNDYFIIYLGIKVANLEKANWYSLKLRLLAIVISSYTFTIIILGTAHCLSGFRWTFSHQLQLCRQKVTAGVSPCGILFWRHWANGSCAFCSAVVGRFEDNKTSLLGVDAAGWFRACLAPALLNLNQE